MKRVLSILAIANIIFGVFSVLVGALVREWTLTLNGLLFIAFGHWGCPFLMRFYR